MKSINDVLLLLNSDDEEAKINFLFDVCSQSPKHVDAAVLLGCGTEQALLRAEIAVKYYNNGFTNLIISSGGVKHEYKGQNIAECFIMAERLSELGVPDERIIKESNSQNTIGNMVYSLGELCKRGLLESEFNSLTVITEPYHLKRALMLARTYFPEFIKIYGYTENSQEQFKQCRNDEALKKCVQAEFYLIKQLIENGKINKEMLI